MPLPSKVKYPETSFLNIQANITIYMKQTMHIFFSLKVNLSFLFLLVFLFASQSVQSIYFKHIGMADGLPQVSVMSIHQDQLGRMWFGTREGISIYDGENMTVYKAWSEGTRNTRTDILPGNECDFIHENNNGDIFFRTNQSLVKYDIRKEDFSIIHANAVKTITSVKGEIWCAAGDTLYTYDASGDSLCFRYKTMLPNITYLLASEEDFWIGTTGGLYFMKKGQAPQAIIKGRDVYRIFESSTNEIWVGTRMEGLYRIFPDGNIVYYQETDPGPQKIASNQIRDFIEDKYGNIWFGTFKGLYKYNPYTDEFTYSTRDQLPGGLSHSSVFSLYLDEQGTIWAGTYYGGVNYFNPESDIFTHYTDNPSRNDCLNYPFVGRMAEDKRGNVWICTEGGGLNFFDRKTRTFRYYTSGPGNSLPHDNLKSICYDEKRETLYLGTHTGGLSRFDIKTEQFYNYLEKYQEGDTTKPGNIINQTLIYNDKLYVADRNRMIIEDLTTGEFDCLPFTCTDFTFDNKGYLWLASYNQLTRVDPNNPEDVKKFSSRDYNIRFNISRIISTDHGIYFGTIGDGLFHYDEEKDSFICYSVLSGHLASNYCYDIAETNHGNLLITSDKGITLLNPVTENFRFILLGVSLPIISITSGCGVLVCRNSELFVGGTEGFTTFWEEDLEMREKDYSLYFSNLYVHNEKIYPEGPTEILKEGLPYTEELKLSYDQNNLIINFATTNYIDIQKSSEYEYRLIGFDNEWISTSNTSIYYTNLNPGKYVLHVREKNIPSYAMSRKDISLPIIITQPWYNTALAWIIYLLTTLTILYFIIRTKKARRELALSLDNERREKERNEELNQAKLRFFTNISHEFRTPLTLIISQIDLLFQSSNLSPTVYNKIIKISKNANRMRGMITELLEFRKFEQNFFTLRVSEQNIIPFLKDICLSFHELAVQQSIGLTFKHDDDEIMLWFDSYQLQKVFYNLLTNAFKYTRQGSIEINISTQENDILVKVIDTGIGMAAEDLSRIFDRFYQAENGIQSSNSNPGTGIGLALSKNIVEAHHGKIHVQSQVNYGTIFTVTLHKGNKHFQDDPSTVLLENPDEPMVESGSLPDTFSTEEYTDLSRIFPGIEDGTRYKVLIVEDNEELLQILHTLFEPLYTVILARNGEEGLQEALSERPDLIVSDVMMPGMTGTEMCLKIKNNIDLCHIPIVLLTALNTIEHNIEGLQHGADDYIEKPFHAKVLLMRCNNLIRNRLLIQSKMNKQVDFDIQLLAGNPLDKKFLEQVSEVIEKHMDDTGFDVNQLAKETGIGRSSLFTKFKALTGMTPHDYIQSYRLKKAAVLLRENPSMQITEIADILGFSSSVYFSRCFKAQFGISPNQFRQDSSTV